MPPLVPVILVSLTAILVYAAAWRMLSPQNAFIGGASAVLLFLAHPAVLSGIQNSSPWDAVFVMLFLSAWLWMQNWSLFMRSWVLAGVFSFGLWVGSPFVLWGLVAMVPWVLYNRRPLAAVGSLVTVFVGGVLLFAITWGGVWLLLPTIGRPLFTQWIRWGGVKLPPQVSLPWCLLVSGAVYARFRDMFQNHRSDASMFGATLLLVTVFLGSSNTALVLIALSAPLIARLLVKKEFLFHRRVRWTAGSTFALVLVFGYVMRLEAWIVTGLAMVCVGLISRWVNRKARLPRFMVGEAVCIGAFFAESIGTVLNLFPR